MRESIYSKSAAPDVQLTSVAGCLPWTHPARDRWSLSAMASAPGRRHLPAVVELAEQALRPEDGGGLWADTLQPRQHGRRRGRLVTGGLSKASRSVSTVFNCP